MTLSGKKKILFWVAISVLGILTLAIAAAIVSRLVSAPPSPKGQIVFVSRRDFRSSKTGEETALYKMYSDGSKQERLTDDKMQYESPSWSKDRKQIVFVRKEQIYTMDSQGLGRLRLTERGSFPQWSPDGRKIFFIRQTTGYENHLFVINSDGSEQKLLATGHVTQAEWSPDGKKIVYTKGRSGPDKKTRIYLISSDGTGEVVLPAGESGDANSPSWSPDGRKIAFGSFSGNEKSDIYVIGADGSNLRKLSLSKNLENWKYLPKFSPDGKHIVFSVSKNSPWSKKNDPVNIATANVDGSKPVQLTHFKKGEFVSDLKWTTDSKEILFTLIQIKTVKKKEEARANIYLVTPDGKLKQLTKTNADFSPDWSGIKE